MDKKAGAIIAIIALHLTVMWFIRGNFQPEELARGTEPAHPDASPIEPNPYLPPTTLASDMSGENVVSAPTRVLLQAAANKPYATPRYARPIKTKKQYRGIDKAYAVKVPVFRDTVIYVKRADFYPSQVGERLVFIDPSAKPIQTAYRPIQTQKQKKKSIFKRAVPVIRKPYEWMKTLVSKL